MTMQKQKRAYQAPKLTVHGSVEAITRHAAVGTRLDVGFDAETPVSDLTFS